MNLKHQCDTNIVFRIWYQSVSNMKYDTNMFRIWNMIPIWYEYRISNMIRICFEYEIWYQYVSNMKYDTNMIRISYFEYDTNTFRIWNMIPICFEYEMQHQYDTNIVFRIWYQYVGLFWMWYEYVSNMPYEFDTNIRLSPCPNESCHIWERVMSHANKSCHTNTWVTSHIYTCCRVFVARFLWVPCHENESYVMSKSCVTHMSKVVAFSWIFFFFLWVLCHEIESYVMSYYMTCHW